MEQIKVKFKTYDIIENIDDDTFVVIRKDKKYLVTKFVPKSEEGEELSYSMNRISTSGVSTPKLIAIDKKQGYIIREHIVGDNLMNMLSIGNLEEKIYEQLFFNAYMAKINRITLNYEPDKWVFSNGKLFYMYPFFIIYNDEKDLVKKYLRLWFPTKELQAYLKAHNLPLENRSIKEEYAVNKEIVLMTCKYYK